MPSESQHKYQFIHNYKCVQLFQQKSVNDWVVTASFYACVHAIEWYFCRKHNHHSASHTERERKMAASKELKSIYSGYRELSDLSQETRYDCVFSTLTSDDVSFSVGMIDTISSHIREIYSDFPDMAILKVNSSE